MCYAVKTDHQGIFDTSVIFFYYLFLVSNFSKKTGDYKSLSAVDIKVLALTYQLEKEHVGSEHIKTVPERKVFIDLDFYPSFVII